MIAPEHFFADRKRTLDQGLGVGLAALALQDLAEIVQERRDRGMFRAGGLLVDRKRPPEQRFGIGVAVLSLVQRGEIVEGPPDVGMAGG
jgi:hypothetical protein